MKSRKKTISLVMSLLILVGTIVSPMRVMTEEREDSLAKEQVDSTKSKTTDNAEEEKQRDKNISKKANDFNGDSIKEDKTEWNLFNENYSNLTFNSMPFSKKNNYLPDQTHDKSNKLIMKRTDLDFSKLKLNQFRLHKDNMKILSKSNSVEQRHFHKDFSEGANYDWTAFFFKIPNRSYKGEYRFDNPLKLSFEKAGKINGRYVDVVIDVTQVKLRRPKFGKNGEFGYLGDKEIESPNKYLQTFFIVGENNGKGLIGVQDYLSLGGYKQVPQAFVGAYALEAYLHAEYVWSDNKTKCDYKMVMTPSDIDINRSEGKTQFNETFWMKNIEKQADKVMLNHANRLNIETRKDGWTKWEATGRTEGAWEECNKSGFVIRSKNGSFDFCYETVGGCGTLYGFYTETGDSAIREDVEPKDMQVGVGKSITYKVDFKIPRVGIDTIDDISVLKVESSFDRRVDYKSLTVKSSSGYVLKENVDYKVSCKDENNPWWKKTGIRGSIITVKIINEKLLSHPEQSKFTNYTITYNMKTNDKIVDNAKDILSSSTLVLNDSSLKSNIVKTTLWDILEIKKEWKSKNPNIDVNVTLKRKVGNDVDKSFSQRITLKAKNNWKYTTGRLDIQNSAERKYTYYIEEEVPDGYELVGYRPKETMIGLGQVRSLTAINQKSKAKSGLTIEKLWQDEDGSPLNQNGFVTGTLKRRVKVGNRYQEDTTFSRKVKIEKANNWKTVVNGLDVKDKAGRNYLYRIEEDVPKGFFIAGYKPREIELTNTVDKNLLQVINRKGNPGGSQNE
ncbi:Sgo0707 family adhesin [Parvimonas sp. C2]|uniref:Sgo0707 family adhesin n=1 Tax=Parvimonas sp. C2 TaxID=3110692 RepID=UPI002B463DF6|nr:Sgo0707 family adhesin [Parvimonas sp. C2]MEB3073254.1 Sgo0707 family adhesin [Parvimonas sp. C2]